MRVVHQTATPRELVGTLRTMLTAVRRMRECAKSEDALARSQLLRGLVAAASDATGASAILNLQSDDCFEAMGIDFEGLREHAEGRERAPLGLHPE